MEAPAGISQPTHPGIHCSAGLVRGRLRRCEEGGWEARKAREQRGTRLASDHAKRLVEEGAELLARRVREAVREEDLLHQRHLFRVVKCSGVQSIAFIEVLKGLIAKPWITGV